MITAEIIAIGNEVVDGTIINSNAAWLAQQLSQAGYSVQFHSAIPDEEALMLEAFARAQERAQVVVVTGGLGPTIDDLTMEVASKYFKKPLVLNEAALEKIKSFFAKVGRKPSPNQEKQAWIPEGSEVLVNGRGTAPGAYHCHEGVHFGFFPGIPSEMELMFQEGFLPRILSQEKPASRRYLRVIHCFGLPEGQMDQELRGQTLKQLESMGLQLGFRVRFPAIDLRLETQGADEQSAMAQLDAGEKLIREVLGDHVFGTGDDELRGILGELLRERGETLAVAESCTGGMLANEITHVPGSSDYFLGGVVTYANQAKQEILGVLPETLQQHGAVSSAVVLEMAHGVRSKFKSHWALATSGIAGPSGGTPEKPVGTVHIALLGPDTQWEQSYCFPLGRLLFKKVVVAMAMDRLRRVLMGLP